MCRCRFADSAGKKSLLPIQEAGRPAFEFFDSPLFGCYQASPLNRSMPIQFTPACSDMKREKRFGARCMSKPLLVTIPHRLGKEEAIRRLKSGLGSVRTNFGHVLSVQEENWTSDHLRFRVSALGQVAAGTVAVTATEVHLEVTLPWLLAQLGEKLQPLLRKQGNLMLEKK